MRRKIALLTAAILALGLSASTVMAADYTWKLSSVATQEEAQGQAQTAFEEKLEELTGGAVDVQNYFSGTLYSQDACTEAVVTGDLEINSSSPAYVSEYYPAAGMFTAAYMFKSYDHLQKFLASDVYQEYRKKIEDNTNFVLLGIWYQGSRGLDLNTDKEVAKPEDLQGMTVRMPNTEAWLNLGNSLGFNATGLAFTEVYTAQQTGVIEGNDNPIGIAANNAFDEVSKQYVRTNHLVDEVYLIMNKDLFYSVDEDLQAKILEAAAYAGEVMADNVIANEDALYQKWADEGIKIVDPDVDAFVEHSLNYYQENGLTEAWDMDLYDKIQALAE